MSLTNTDQSYKIMNSETVLQNQKHRRPSHQLLLRSDGHFGTNRYVRLMFIDDKIGLSQDNVTTMVWK